MTELCVHTSGDPTSPAIVFLHGGSMSGRMWQPQVEGLSEYYCLVPDLPEHARSAAIQPFTLQGAACEVAKLIQERIPNGRAHLVGGRRGGVGSVAHPARSGTSYDLKWNDAKVRARHGKAD